MNPNRILTLLIVALMILGTFFAAQSAEPVTAKARDGKCDYSNSIVSDTNLLGQTEMQLGEVLDEIDSDAEVKAQLYGIARNAHVIALRTAFYLGIDMSTGIDRGNLAFDPPGDFEMNIATKGDITRLDTMNDALTKYDDRLKDLLSGASPSDLEGESSAKNELQEIHDQATSISKTALTHLGIESFLYGNILDCEPHEPIKIHSNEEFTEANGVVNGSGTQADPYIISGWEILTNSYYGIEILNTDAHFMIRNVCIHHGETQPLFDYDGIYMSGVQNGAVLESSIYNNRQGVNIKDSPGIRIEGNFFSSNDGNGIFVQNSPGSVIEGNRLLLQQNTNAGIVIRLSDHSTISDNELKMNDKGIFVDESHYVTITFNNITKNEMTGVSIASSNHNLVSNCRIEDNDVGIILLQTSHVDLVNNIIFKNGEKGIGISSDNHHIDIMGNIITENGGSAIAGSGVGISLFSSSFIFIINNQVERNEGRGIVIGNYCSNIYIIGNEIVSNVSILSIEGISVVGSSGILIKCNNITEHHPASSGIILTSMVGVYLTYTASGVTVVHNNFIDNAMQGIDQSGVNTWDSGYPDGGNYWRDKLGSDKKSGPNQDIEGSDGIHDTPHSFDFYDSSHKDYYPLAEPVDINECMEPWLWAQFTVQLLGKLYKSSNTLAQINMSLMSTYASIQKTVADTECALSEMREDAGMIVSSITEVLGDNYPCLGRTTPGLPDDDGGSGHKFTNSQNKYTTDAPANKLEAYTKTVVNVDQRLILALDKIGEAPDQTTVSELMEMRDAANNIVYKITRQLGDQYPCMPIR